MADIERILIVGGGIAGLTLAAALHRQGFTAEIVERSPAWPALGAGILLHGNGLRTLRAVGAAEAVERAGAVVRRWSWCDVRGEPLCATALDALWAEVGPCIGIARARLHAALVGVVATAGIPSRLGVTLTALEQDDRRVSARFSDGSGGDYDLVVGADGISSTVRRLLLGDASPAYCGLMVWRSLLPMRPSGLTEMQIQLGDGCLFGLMPLGSNHTTGFGLVGGPRIHDPLQGRLERLRRRFAAFGGPVPRYLATLECDAQIHCAPIELVDLATWHRGRVVLIGDAAHAGPPTMAQGGCMAMEDASVLAEVLRMADTMESALATFERRRRPRTAWVQQQSRAVVESLLLPPIVRDATLRKWGERLMQERFRPLLAAP